MARHLISRSLAAPFAKDLLTALEEGETVAWVTPETGWRVQGAAFLTSRRILVLSATAQRSIWAPFVVEHLATGPGPTKVRVSDGTNEVTVSLKPTDLTEVTRLARPSRPGDRDGYEPQQPSEPRRPEPTATGPSIDGTPSGNLAHDTDAQPPLPPRSAPRGTEAPRGGWRWMREVASWKDAEEMAAAHAVHLGFTGVTPTPPGSDGGLDVVSRQAAAQVKRHGEPTGSADIQRLRGAADSYTHRLFYATGYTAAAKQAAESLGIALFQFDTEGRIHAVNEPARVLMLRTAAQPQQRDLLGRLPLESRQDRALTWVRQLQAAAQAPISDRKRKGAKQLAARQRALTLVAAALEQLESTESPLFKKRRRERAMGEVETTLKAAGRELGMTLK